jgi:phospholipid/cholesterol/gamma-HCH transport system permease protein
MRNGGIMTDQSPAARTDLVLLVTFANAVLNLCETIGHSVMLFFASVGRLVEFAAKAFANLFMPPWFGKQIGRQFVDIGYYSLAVVGLTTLFSGMVLALQSYTGFARFNAEGAIANVVALSITRELAPVLAGLMVAGRIGASIAAEIGTMRVTEQIDALSTLNVNPFKYLVVPRILAGTVIMPVLVLIGDIIGIFGGFLVSVYRLGFNAHHYVDQTMQFLQPIDVVSGLVKAAVFGFIVTLMGCYNGYNSDRGAQGVGAATTNAVVSASMLCLIFNYLLTQVFFS